MRSDFSKMSATLRPAPTIAAQGESGALLALMGKKAAGSWLELWVIIDAAMVLTGAVLTAFVGYTGVTTRMAMDRLMPEVPIAIEIALRRAMSR